MDRPKILSAILLCFHMFVLSSALPSANIQMLGRWCCLNLAEYAKCRDWMLALNQTSAAQNPVVLECVLATDKFDCFKKIFEDKADLMTADAGEVYTAGKYYNLLPIATESYYGGPTQPTYTDTYAVAVVKRGSGMSISNLQGANSCHDGVGTSSGWNIPISTLIEKKLLEIVDCNNHVKAATKFFNKMCAPDALNSQFNPTGDNPTSACELCRGRIGSTFCTNQDPYAGSIGAMYCLIDGGGDVAFVKHTTLNELASLNRSVNLNNFELLCPNVIGSPYITQGNNVSVYPYPTAPLNDYLKCNWGVVPARAILTSSRKALVQRRIYRDFLRDSVSRFGTQTPFNAFPQATIYQTTTQSMQPNSSIQNPIPAPFANMNPYNPQMNNQFNPMNPMNPMMNQMSPNPIMGNNNQQPGWNNGMNQINQMNPMMNNPNNMNYFPDGSGGSSINGVQGGFNMPNIAGNQYTDPNNPMSFNFTQGAMGFDIGYQNPIIFNFKLFESTPYHGRDLIFLDQTISFMDLDDKTSYLTFLTENYRSKILKLYECPLRLVRWCVISDFEKDKCRLMRNAFASRNVKPDLDCVSASSAWECMSMIKNRLADLITLDPADAYRASRYFGLLPLAAEDYGTIDEDTEKPIFYSVAVVKRTDLTTNLWNLRTRKACGTAFGDMAGYHVPVNYLIQIKELYVTDCNVPKVAGEYLGRCCMPGALDYNYNTLKTNPRALCLRCYSKGADYCSRSHREYFYGDTGAFRCINEGHGDVAFVKHTSVQSNTDGRNTDQWAYGLRQTDYELLCKDGTRRSTEKYAECNLMKVPSRVVMVGGFRTDIQRSYLWNMLNFAQQLFGSDTNPDFSLFESFKEHPDLIFSDSCMQLFQINTDIESYLGSEVIEIIHKTDPRICNKAAYLSSSSLYYLLVFILVSYLLF